MFSLIGFGATAQASIEVYEFDNPSQEAQYKGLIEEFRCPKCQNQNLAGSDSQISQDLKRKTYEMVMAGQSDAQIREYMYERYGDFISYKPPVRPSTWILWYFPPLILLLLVAGWLLRTKAHNKKQVTTVQSTEGIQQTATTHNSELDKVGANLSSEEAQKLKALLKEHSNQDLSNKE
ncbi:cytochrome c-type biogenesis protein [Psychrobacter sanguinis]|uniref:cytochrome c-type biogenesis protein n=1 Tax=Psychrobacter sanguinis TaxID=861445 RepID=UPI0028A5C9D0|nr:cytochrome c-type biogenesis protein [Psychrobacter sanguinis]